MSARGAGQVSYLFDRTSLAILNAFLTATGALLVTVVLVAIIGSSAPLEVFSLAEVGDEVSRRAPAALILGLGLSLYLTVTVLFPLSLHAKRRNWARSWHSWALAGGIVTLPITIALQFATAGERPFVDLGGLVFLFAIGAAASLAGFLGMRRRA